MGTKSKSNQRKDRKARKAVKGSKSKGKGLPKRKKRRKRKQRSVTASSDTVSVALLVECRKLADRMGGIDKARQALDYLARLGIS